MAVNLNAVALRHGVSITPVAPQIEGVSAAILQTGTEPRFDTDGNVTGRYGMRIPYSPALNFSGSDYLSFVHECQQWGPGHSIAPVADGGNRVIFVDASGHYAGFNTYGADVPGYDGGGGSEGYLASWSVINIVFMIAITRTPDIGEGVVDWSNIVAIEFTALVPTGSVSRKDAAISSIARRGAPIITGVETLESLAGAAKSAGGGVRDPQLVGRPPRMLSGVVQTAYTLRIGLTVGDGVTTTNFTQTQFALGFDNPHEFSPSFVSVGPWTQLGDQRRRPLKIVQSPTDVLSLTDGSIASAGWWQWELSGSGNANCTRVQFWRSNGFKAAHGHYVDCTWNDADTAVEVTGATVISGGLIRGAKSTALKIIGAAGVYSGLELEIDGLAATYDVELGEGGAGTYDLPNITVPDGRTLRIRNNSAVNAVVVKLPLGLAYSTSTAGGAITVEIPEVSVAVVASALISGSRVQLYNVTDGIEMFNSVLPSSGLAHTALYTGNKIVRLRADHASKLPLETAGVLTPSGLTFLDVQAEDDVYLGNGIDGGAVSEFAPDGANIQVDINDPDGVTNIQRLYAWLQWYMTTEEGVRSAFFGAVSAIDSANYVINQTKADIKLDNVAAFPVRVVGGYLSRRDGSTVIAPLSHSIQMDPGKAYAIETGVSGLTSDESAKLNQISALALESTAQATLAASEAIPTAVQTASAVWSHTQ